MNTQSQDFLFEFFAAQYFRNTSTGESRGISKRVKYEQGMLQSPILPLLSLQPRHVNVSMFLYRQIMKCVINANDNDYRIEDPVYIIKILSTVIQKYKGLLEIIDELYCQLVKFTNENPNQRETIFGFQIMLCCLSSFPPSKLLRPYMKSYLQRHPSSHANVPRRVFSYARICANRLSQAEVLGAREIPPGTSEIVNILRGHNSSVDVHILNGTVVSVLTDSWSTPLNAKHDLSRALCLKDDIAFSLYIVFPVFLHVESNDLNQNSDDSFGTEELLVPNNVSLLGFIHSSLVNRVDRYKRETMDNSSFRLCANSQKARGAHPTQAIIDRLFQIEENLAKADFDFYDKKLFKVIFKRRLFIDMNIFFDDAIALELCYFQALRDYLTKNADWDRNDVVMLSSLVLLVRFGRSPADVSKSQRLVDQVLHEIVPEGFKQDIVEKSIGSEEMVSASRQSKLNKSSKQSSSSFVDAAKVLAQGHIAMTMGEVVDETNRQQHSIHDDEIDSGRWSVNLCDEHSTFCGNLHDDIRDAWQKQDMELNDMRAVWSAFCNKLHSITNFEVHRFEASISTSSISCDRWFNCLRGSNCSNLSDEYRARFGKPLNLTQRSYGRSIHVSCSVYESKIILFMELCVDDLQHIYGPPESKDILQSPLQVASTSEEYEEFKSQDIADEFPDYNEYNRAYITFFIGDNTLKEKLKRELKFRSISSTSSLVFFTRFSKSPDIKSNAKLSNVITPPDTSHKSSESKNRIDVFLGVDATNGTPAILSGRTDESRGSLNARTTSDTENSSQSTANVSTATDESSYFYKCSRGSTRKQPPCYGESTPSKGAVYPRGMSVHDEMIACDAKPTMQQSERAHKDAARFQQQPLSYDEGTKCSSGSAIDVTEVLGELRIIIPFNESILGWGFDNETFAVRYLFKGEEVVDELTVVVPPRVGALTGMIKTKEIADLVHDYYTFPYGGKEIQQT